MSTLLNGEVIMSQLTLPATNDHEYVLKLYTPHSAQLKFHNSKTRYRVAAWGRQSGKSTACLNELAFKAWMNPNARYWFISPTYEQAKLQYRRFVGMLSGCWGILLKKNQTELRCKFINQSTVRFVSGEVLHNLRGETLHGVVIDEVRDQPDELWSMVIRPMLATTKGWACFVSTPNGLDKFYDFFEKGKDPHQLEWDSFQAPSTCNPLFTQEEMEASQKEMSEDEFAQEILAEFREMGVGKVYKNHGVHNHAHTNPFTNGELWSPYLPIICGLDFNVGLMAWVLMQHKAGGFYFGDEIAVSNTNTEECAYVLAEKVKDHKPGIVIIGDASGKARKTSASGKTDYSIIMNVMKEYGIRVDQRTPSDNPAVKDRINCMNSALKSADGSVHLWYNPLKCKYLKRDFERVKWKEGTDGANLDKSDPLCTHASDSAGYPVAYYSSLLKIDVGKMRVIVR